MKSNPTIYWEKFLTVEKDALKQGNCPETVKLYFVLFSLKSIPGNPFPTYWASFSVNRTVSLKWGHPSELK